MRASPDSKAEMVSQALFGESVEIQAQTGEWSLVRTPDGYAGWVRGDAVVPCDAAAPAKVVTSLIEPVLDGPDGEPRGLLPLGAIVHENAQSSGNTTGPWTRIHFGMAGEAFIRTAALDDPPSRAKPVSTAELAATAKRLLGVPYLWGGRTPFGIDCSGFTQLVYGLHGTVIPRDAYRQAAWEGCRRVDTDDLREGDLLFFGGDADPRRRGITHVGMALDAHRFIHSAGGIGVTISGLSDAPYGRLLRLCARVATTVP